MVFRKLQTDLANGDLIWQILHMGKVCGRMLVKLNVEFLPNAVR